MENTHSTQYLNTTLFNTTDPVWSLIALINDNLQPPTHKYLPESFPLSVLPTSEKQPRPHILQEGKEKREDPLSCLWILHILESVKRFHSFYFKFG